MDIQKHIDINQFPHKITLNMSSDFDEKASDILRKNGIPIINFSFNTKRKHQEADIVDQIRWYDCVWEDNDGDIIAFWDRKTKVLMF